MEPDHSIAVRYAHLTDGELLQLSKESATLTSEAQAALRGELSKRTLPHEGFWSDNEAKGIVTSNGTTIPFKLVKYSTFLIGHTLIGAVGVSVAAAMFFYSIKVPLLAIAPSLAIHNAVLMTPFFPLQVFAGVLNGFLVARKHQEFWKSKVAEWAWVFPALLIAVMLTSYAQNSVTSETRWQHFFWTSVVRSRVQQMGTTLLFLTSVAYSAGHYLGRKIKHDGLIVVRASSL